MIEMESNTRGLVHDLGRRYPKIVSPDAYDAIDYLTDGDRALGKSMIAMMDPALTPGVKQPQDHAEIQRRNPTMAMLWDPALFAADVAYYDVLAKATFGMTNAELMQSTDENGLTTADPDIRSRFEAAL